MLKLKEAQYAFQIILPVKSTHILDSISKKGFNVCSRFYTHLFNWLFWFLLTVKDSRK